jgi:hypothetical protein
LANAAQASLAELAILQDENQLLFKQNNEAKLRRSTKSTVVADTVPLPFLPGFPLATELSLAASLATRFDRVATMSSKPILYNTGKNKLFLEYKHGRS